jgi:hypothetical protein
MTSEKPAPRVADNVVQGLMNLHDAYLNASLQRTAMERAPLEREPEVFHTSDRARYERTWAMFLYVLIEAWLSKSASEVRDFVRQVADTAPLDDLIAKAKEGGDLDAMFEGRSYMCHRDRREYWDAGRSAVFGRLELNQLIDREFGRILLTALRAIDSVRGTSA